MYKVALLGAGKIGETIALMLANSGRYAVKVADNSRDRVDAVAKLSKAIIPEKIAIEKSGELTNFLKGCDAVVSALPFWCNTEVAKAARELNLHYFDLTEDVKITKEVREISKGANTVFMPQCGLAPGFISIVAHDLINGLTNVRSLKLRVGALPIFPSNRLKYALTWSTDGLVNEYCNPCEAIVDGKQVMVTALEGYERFTIEGTEFEAFNTSGGLGSLAETLMGKVSSLTYKTVRYPGHRDLIAFLLHDLGFINNREALVALFNHSLPATKQDQCVVYAEAIGSEDGKITQRTYANIVPYSAIAGHTVTAIQRTTASGVCVPLDLALTKNAALNNGLSLPEQIPLKTFLNNEFAEPYRI